MKDIVERLRAYTMGDFDTYAVLRHRGAWIAQVTMIREASDLMEAVHGAAAEIERLRAALQVVMVGGNHLVALLPPTVPPPTTPHAVVLAEFGAGTAYEAWCCWAAIMRARIVLEPQDDEP